MKNPNCPTKLIFITSGHHFLLHGRMCSDCAAVADAMCQKGSRTCKKATLFKIC